LSVAGAAEGCACRDPSLAADHDANALEFLCEFRVELDAIVERLGDFAVDARQAVRQARVEIAAAKRAQSGQKAALSKILGHTLRGRSGRAEISPRVALGLFPYNGHRLTPREVG